MSFWLVMKTAAGGERPFLLQKPRTVIGRDPSSDLHVSMPTVSPKHCEIILNEKGLRLADLESESGTFHNGNCVAEVVLTDSDQVTVGAVTFEVRRTEDRVEFAEPTIVVRKPPGIAEAAAEPG